MLTYLGDIVGHDDLLAILGVWDGEVVDFGGGVRDILVDDFLALVGNSYVKWSKRTGIPRKRMKQIIGKCRDVAGFGHVYREAA